MSLAMAIDQGPRDNIEDAAQTAQIRCLPFGESLASVLVVGDGVGGAAGGEVAAGLAVACVANEITFQVGSPADARNSEAMARRVEAIVADAIRHANDLVVEVAQGDPHFLGMATTLVCGVALVDTLIVAWVGDSRCYLFREGHVERVTRDHSKVAELLTLGLITPDEAASHPSAHTITRYLGQPEGCRPEIRFATIAPGDLVLLCTDGLTDVLADSEIEHVLQSYLRKPLGLKSAVDELVHSAVARQTQDNTTVVLYEHRADGETSGITDPQTVTHGYNVAVANTLRNFRKENHDEHELGETHT